MYKSSYLNCIKVLLILFIYFVTNVLTYILRYIIFLYEFNNSHGFFNSWNYLYPKHSHSSLYKIFYITAILKGHFSIIFFPFCMLCCCDIILSIILLMLNILFALLSILGSYNFFTYVMLCLLVYFVPNVYGHTFIALS